MVPLDKPTTIDEIIDEVKRLDTEGTPRPWRWWTSCSHRRLSSDATGRDGDVLHGDIHPIDRQPDVVCSEADRALIAAYRSYAPALRKEVLRLRSVLANVLNEQPESEADPIFDPRLGDTCFAVEATSFEKLALWEEWHNKVEWVPDLSGLAPMIGHFGGMPIVLNLFWSRIGGIRVLFWQHVSMVTHSRMAEEWLHANCGACCEYVSALKTQRTMTSTMSVPSSPRPAPCWMRPNSNAPYTVMPNDFGEMAVR